MELTEVARLFLLGLMLVVFAYAVVRSASFAYFRTKYEYMRQFKRESKEGEK
jgi:hypothetical protein